MVLRSATVVRQRSRNWATAAFVWAFVWALIAAIATSGCSRSLFDGRDRDPAGPTEQCPDPCLANAASDFDGSATGSTQRWRYLEDPGNRTWSAMTADGQAMVGRSGNRITTCSQASSSTCTVIPGALLVSAEPGATDPAIEFTAEYRGTLQLRLIVFVPDDEKPQPLLLYRGSREDLLWRGTGMPGQILQKELVVDALMGDRFLLTLASPLHTASNIGIHFFVTEDLRDFPVSCQLALPFSSGSRIPTGFSNQCGPDDNSAAFDAKMDHVGWTPTSGPGPYAEAGDALALAETQWLEGRPGSKLDKSHDFTVQFWVRTTSINSEYAGFPFSDIDINPMGGIGVDIFWQNGGTVLEYYRCTSLTPPHCLAPDRGIIPWQNNTWRFVRIVHTGNTVSLCVDGVREKTFAAPTASLASFRVPYIGKNVVWTPANAYFTGSVDDVRAFSEALPCE